VLELVGAVDQVIRVGSVIAYMDVADDGTVAAVTPAPVVTVTAAQIPAAPPPAHAVAPSGKRLRVSPAARHLAEKNGIDLNTLHGTGHDGAIELQDVEAVLEKKDSVAVKAVAPVPAVPQKSGASMINVREAIARAMTKSKREIPHYYLQSRFHIDVLVAWLDAKNRSLPPEERLFMPAVLMRAVVLALQSNPDMNGYYENGAFVQRPEIHLGITVSLKPSGVMTPAVIDAHAMTLAELNAAFADLVQRARAGKLRNREMTDGTVTVTNVGDLGADAVTGVIFPPQVALVGFGRVRKAPVVDGDGGVRAGFVIDTSLSADHRVSDGLAGSKMLNAIGRLLAQPEQLDK
jgi:pyruvate dehydrogenase E2 component (dihydrolipoamide acetyltransferase)